MSRLIVLNGTSSSGKTTLAKALQKELSGRWLHFQMDYFWDMVPEGVEATSIEFPNLKKAMMRSLNAVLDEGHDVILDIVCASYDPRTLSELLDFIQEHDIFAVAVKADLEDLEKREAQRKDRDPGLAKMQYEGIHDHYEYNFIADTSKHSAKDLAKELAICLKK